MNKELPLRQGSLCLKDSGTFANNKFKPSCFPGLLLFLGQLLVIFVLIAMYVLGWVLRHWIATPLLPRERGMNNYECRVGLVR